MKAVTTVIFDCFGVLYPVYIDNYYKKHKDSFVDGHVFLDELNRQIDLGQISQAQFYQAIWNETGIPANQIATDIESELVVDQELIRFITELKKKYKVGLLSNAGQEEIAVIYRDKIDNLFDAITVSYEVGDIKPNPKIFNVCLERLDSRPEESVFVDDVVKNLLGAQRAGLQTIHYPTFGSIPKELHELLAL